MAVHISNLKSNKLRLSYLLIRVLEYTHAVYNKVSIIILTALLSMFAIGQVQAGSEFTFNYALKIANKNSPLLKSAESLIRSSNGQFIQSDTLPNPSVNVYSENIAGSGTYKDLNAAETTIEVSQPILLGGKRAADKEVQKGRIKLSKESLLKIKAKLYTMLGERYINVIYAQNWLKTTNELIKINRDIVLMLKRKLKAGSGSPLDLITAQIQLSHSSLAQVVAKQELQTAWRRLVFLMGDNKTPYQFVLDKGLPHALPSYSKLSELLIYGPIWKSGVIKSDVAYKRIILSRKLAWPDLTIGIGVRHFSDSSDNSLVAGISLPLPIFNHNQGNTMSRKADYDASLSDQHQLMIDLQSELSELYQNALSSQYRTKIIKNNILPKAKKAVLLAQEGYFKGVYPYVTLANAQETLLQTEKEYWVSHAKYDRTLVKINGLLGIK